MFTSAAGWSGALQRSATLADKAERAAVCLRSVTAGFHNSKTIEGAAGRTAPAVPQSTWDTSAGKSRHRLKLRAEDSPKPVNQTAGGNGFSAIWSAATAQLLASGTPLLLLEACSSVSAAASMCWEGKTRQLRPRAGAKGTLSKGLNVVPDAEGHTANM